MKLNKNKIFVIYEICLLVLVIVTIVVLIYSFIHNVFLKSKNDKDIVKDYHTIGTLEIAIGNYCDAIEQQDFNRVNDMLWFNNKKSKTEIKKIAESINISENWLIRVAKATKIEKDAYRCEVQKMVYEDRDTFVNATIVIKLYPDNKTFYIIDDNWN